MAVAGIPRTVGPQPVACARQVRRRDGREARARSGLAGACRLISWSLASNRQIAMASASGACTATLIPPSTTVTPRVSGDLVACSPASVSRAVRLQWIDTARRSGRAGRRQETSAAMALRCMRSQTARSRHSARQPAQRLAEVRRDVAGENWIPVATPAASAASLASITVSARPPTRDTTGMRAVAQGAKLRQAAGFEARGHQQGVATGLDQVGERLIVADDAADPAEMGRGRGGEGVFQRRVRRTRAWQAACRSATTRVEPVQQQVQALLRGQAADDADQQRIGIFDPGPSACCSAALLAARLAQRSPRENRAGISASAGRVPDRRRRCRSGCPDRLPARCAQHAVEAHAVLRPR